MNDTQMFEVRLTADFCERGEPRYQDMGLEILRKQRGIRFKYFETHNAEIQPEQIQGAQGIIVLTPSVTKATLAGAADTLAIGRFGVGFDAVDVAACTQADVAVFITTGAVDHSVAEAAMGWMLALSHNMIIKDRLVRTGEWDKRSGYMGSELRDRTLGVIGCGGIARKLIDLTSSFGMRRAIAFDPIITQDEADGFGVRLVPLDELLQMSDFVSLHCPLNANTRGLIGERELSLMKRTAFLLNTARGGIVQEDALYDALKSGRIAGAALDSFAQEPVTQPHRFGELDNVILAPHSIAWTHELFRDIGRAVTTGMVEVAHGRKPRGLLNPGVYERTGFQKKMERYRCST